jgi:hypothetical protein
VAAMAVPSAGWWWSHWRRARAAGGGERLRPRPARARLPRGRASGAKRYVCSHAATRPREGGNRPAAARATSPACPGT